MKKYLNLIGGGVGWVLGGPIGAILGFAVGSMIKNTSTEGVQNVYTQTRSHHTTTNDFVASLLVLSAAVMKADNKVMKSELEYVHQFMSKQFGSAKAKEQMLLLRQILKQPLPLRQVCLQIKGNMDHAMRLQLIHYVFGIAMADDKLDSAEVKTIENIARYLGISQKDYESIRAMFGHDSHSAYKILEIDERSTDQEIKKAYRKMALKYHPDKLSELGPEIRKAAEEKFIEVQKAYEAIKKERGIK